MSAFTTDASENDLDGIGQEATENDTRDVGEVEENVHQYEDLTDVDGIMEPYAEQEQLERSGRAKTRNAAPQNGERRHSADAPLNRKSSFNSNNNRSGSPVAEQIITRRASFVNGEYLPESPSLFRTTSSRILDAQALNDRQQQSMRGPPAVRIDESYVPSERLMRTTSARVMDAVTWGELKKQQELERVPPSPKIDESYKPSERLLKTTRSMIIKKEQWESQKEENKYKDDIWWDKRKPLERKGPKPVAASKLNEPTRAYLSSKRSKAPQRPESAPAGTVNDSPAREHAHMPAKLDKDHHLLRQTKATTAGAWKPGMPQSPPMAPAGLPLNLPSKQTGPKMVKSKLHEETAAIKAKKKVLSPDRDEKLNDQAPVAAVGAKLGPVKVTSPSLLAPTTTYANRVRPRSPERDVHPGEKQWNSFAVYSKSSPRALSPPSRPRSALTTTLNTPAKNGTSSRVGSASKQKLSSPGTIAAADAGGEVDGDDTTNESKPAATGTGTEAAESRSEEIEEGLSVSNPRKSSLAKHKSDSLSGSNQNLGTTAKEAEQVPAVAIPAAAMLTEQEDIA